jgi:hypothetical protein
MLGVLFFLEEGKVGMQMVAVSLGDSVKLNELQAARVHTVFKEVVNCEVNGGSIVSIVTPTIGSGPNNIVINGEDLVKIILVLTY